MALGLAYVGVAVTVQDEQAAAAAARAAAKEADSAQQKLEDLQRELQRSVQQEDKAKASLAAARTRLEEAKQAGEEKKQPSFFGKLFGAADPETEAKQAEQDLAAAAEQTEALKQSVAAAEQAYAASRTRATATAKSHHDIRLALESAQAAASASSAGGAEAIAARNAARGAYDEARQQAADTAAKLAQTQARIATLEGEQDSARRAVATATKLAGEAQDKGERALRVNAMREAEKNVAAIAKELKSLNYEATKLTRASEQAQQQVAAAQQQLRAADADAASYEASAARAEAERAQAEQAVRQYASQQRSEAQRQVRETQASQQQAQATAEQTRAEAERLRREADERRREQERLAQAAAAAAEASRTAATEGEARDARLEQLRLERLQLEARNAEQPALKAPTVSAPQLVEPAVDRSTQEREAMAKLQAELSRRQAEREAEAQAQAAAAAKARAEAQAAAAQAQAAAEAEAQAQAAAAETAKPPTVTAKPPAETAKPPAETAKPPTVTAAPAVPTPGPVDTSGMTEAELRAARRAALSGQAPPVVNAPAAAEIAVDRSTQEREAMARLQAQLAERDRARQAEILAAAAAAEARQQEARQQEAGTAAAKVKSDLDQQQAEAREQARAQAEAERRAAAAAAAAAAAKADSPEGKAAAANLKAAETNYKRAADDAESAHSKLARLQENVAGHEREVAGHEARITEMTQLVKDAPTDRARNSAYKKLRRAESSGTDARQDLADARSELAAAQKRAEDADAAVAAAGQAVADARQAFDPYLDEGQRLALRDEAGEAERRVAAVQAHSKESAAIADEARREREQAEAARAAAEATQAEAEAERLRRLEAEATSRTEAERLARAAEEAAEDEVAQRARQRQEQRDAVKEQEAAERLAVQLKQEQDAAEKRAAKERKEAERLDAIRKEKEAAENARRARLTAAEQEQELAKERKQEATEAEQAAEAAAEEARLREERDAEAREQSRIAAREAAKAKSAEAREAHNRAKAQYAEAEKLLEEAEAEFVDELELARDDLKMAEAEFSLAKNEFNDVDKLIALIPDQINDLEQEVAQAKSDLTARLGLVAEAENQAQREHAILAIRNAGARVDGLRGQAENLRALQESSVEEKEKYQREMVLAGAKIQEIKKRIEEIEARRASKTEVLRKELSARQDAVRFFERNLGRTENELVKLGVARKEFDPGAGDRQVSFEGEWETKAQPLNARAATPQGAKYDIGQVVVTGDRDPVLALKHWDEYVNDALYTPMSEADIESFRSRVLKDLQDQGYVFATVSVYTPSLNNGFLKLRVHVGDFGAVMITGAKNHTAKSILKAMHFRTGDSFNYRDLYTNMFGLSARPDLDIDTRLRPRVDEFGRRIVDLELDIREQSPLHLSFNIANTGSKATSDWRLRTALQHTNLTKRHDIGSVEWLTDPFNPGDINAFTTSYVLPLENDASMSVFAGWSQTTIEDVQPAIDLFGEGKHFGLAYSWMVKQADAYNVDARLGWMYQSVENTTVLAGANTPRRDIELSMPSLRLGYSEKAWDKYGGRNFGSITLTGNLASRLGASPTADYQAQNGEADGSFMLIRGEAARFNRLFAGEDEPGKWTLFTRFRAQYASDSLVSAVQKGIGGANSIRGYEEREVVGDSGWDATIELRTPLVDNFIPGLKREPEYIQEHPEDWMQHRLQVVTFMDFGAVEAKKPQPGENPQQSMWSVGAGLRLGLTKHSQFRVDYGFPLEETEESGGSGRGHASLQIQF